MARPTSLAAAIKAATEKNLATAETRLAEHNKQALGNPLKGMRDLAAAVQSDPSLADALTPTQRQQLAAFRLRETRTKNAGGDAA